MFLTHAPLLAQRIPPRLQIPEPIFSSQVVPEPSGNMVSMDGRTKGFPSELCPGAVGSPGPRGPALVLLCPALLLSAVD